MLNSKNIVTQLFRQAACWLGVTVAAAFAVAAIACSTGAPGDTATAAPSTPTATTAVPTATVVPTTAPPSATATAALPTPTPTTAAPNSLEAASDAVFGLVEKLVAELGHRESASPEELLAAEHIKGRFDAMGYSAQIQPFPLEFFDVHHYLQTNGGGTKIIVESPIEVDSPGLLLTLTPKGGLQSGSLVPVGLGRSEDLPADGLAGNIVLIQPGDIPLNDPGTLQSLLDKVNNAGIAGAAAAVISGNITGLGQYRPLFGPESAIPALILPEREIGEQLRTLSEAADVTVSVKIDTQQLQSQNVIAELEGHGEGLVIVGGHYDVVPQTQAGANDNTSGIAVVLALADALAGDSLPFSVRFVAFGAEELGLYGSRHYLASLSEPELVSLIAMLNFDVVASGPFLAIAGDGKLTDLALRVASDLGVEAMPQPLPPWASSDHQPFESVGVPVLSLYGPNVSRIHTPEDRLKFVQPELLGGALLVTVALLQSPEFAR